MFIVAFFLMFVVCSHSFTSSLDIFRPFVGYKEVRLVSKESRHVRLMNLLSLEFLIVLLPCFIRH